MSQSDLEKEENLKKLQTLISRKKQQLSHTHSSIENLRFKVLDKAHELQFERDAHKLSTLTNIRNESFRMDTTKDKINRPSDQKHEVRTYGRMDQSLWTQNEVRIWFNRTDQSDVTYNWSPHNTGYTVSKG